MSESLPWWLGLVTATLAAVLSFFFGRMRLGRENKLQREEELRRRRVEVYASFCAAAVDYRRAQLTRWFAQRQFDTRRGLEEARPDIVEDVRLRRATAWGEYYKVLMLCNDKAVEEAARDVLRKAKGIRDAGPGEVERRSDAVHEVIDHFARVASVTVAAGRPRELAPPPPRRAEVHTASEPGGDEELDRY